METIDYPLAFDELVTYLKDFTVQVVIEHGGYKLSANDETFFIPMSSGLWSEAYKAHIASFVKSVEEKNDLRNLIYGKDSTENIVSCECKDGVTELFIEKDGVISVVLKPQRYYILSPRKFTSDWKPLKGDLYYRYMKEYISEDAFRKDKKIYYGKDIYCINDSKESAMVSTGFTYFKGMKVSDVSILSFDIETMGLTYDRNSAVLLISNTYRSQGKIEKKLFSLDEYNNQKDMLEAWCSWVREKNPSVICGHNIFGYDFRYLDFVAKMCDASLSLGRDNSDLWFNKYESKFRKDGSQDYMYNRAFIYGREIVDTYFLSIHFDVARKYESYGLKQIIKQEGLEKADRQFYDAGQIAKDWGDKDKREKIKQYAMDDADDSLALYNLMIASYFYWTSYTPKSFQSVNYTATGTQLNSFLVRSYLQEGHSIPKADEAVRFEGAISHGYPGIYNNIIKLDAASLYPSIILQYDIHDKRKDPKCNFLKMVKYFTEQRLADKKKAKITGDRYYKDLEQSRKVAINSSYGLLGAPGLSFNSSKNAALVTQYGRDALKKAILWASGQEYVEEIKEVEIEDTQL